MSVKGAMLDICPSAIRIWWDRLEASPIGYRLAKGTFWSLLGTLITRGLGFLSSILVARMLGKVGYGELGIIQSTVGMFGVFAGFGLSVTATRYVAEFREKDREKAGRIIALSGLTATVTAGFMCLLLYFGASWLATNTLNAPHLAGMLKIGTVFLFLQALNGAQNGTLAGFEAFKAIAFISLYCGLASFPLMTLGAYLGGVNGAVWGLVGSMLINWIMNHVAMRRQASKAGISILVLPRMEEFLVLWRFSLPAVFSGLMMTPAVWMCNSFIVNGEDGYAQMGIYNAANVPHTIILMVTSTLQLPLLTAFSNIDKDDERLGRVNMLSSWMIGSFPALLLISFPEIIQLLYGKGYAGPEFIRTVVIVALFTSIVVYKQGLARVLLVREMVWWGVLSNLFWSVVLVASAFFLKSWGVTGLALSYFFAYVVNTVVFIPLYTNRGLVPRNTILSWWTLEIWSVLIVLGVVSLLGTHPAIRVCTFTIGIWLVLRGFRKIMSASSAVPG